MSGTSERPSLRWTKQAMWFSEDYVPSHPGRMVKDREVVHTDESREIGPLLRMEYQCQEEARSRSVQRHLKGWRLRLDV